MLGTSALDAELFGFTPETLAVRDDFRHVVKPVASFVLDGDLTVEVRPGRDTLWIVARRAGGGAVALRTIPWAGDYRLHKPKITKTSATWQIDTVSGRWQVALSILGGTLLRSTITLTPGDDLLLTFWPRDLFPLGPADDPTKAEGRVDAAQRGVNTGLCYLCLDTANFGSVLYVQNLTALNPFFIETRSKPVVGGEWPELGYQPPTAPMGNSPPVDPLKKGVECVISDALVSFRNGCVRDEMQSARQFIDMLAEVYPHLDKPEPEFHDWIERSRRTIADLGHAPDARISHYGHTYLHPYVGAEYPDSMVQMTVLSSLREHELARNVPDRESADLYRELAAGIGRFYDKDLKTVRRYLPNVGAEKDKNAVDSWYLYHPLMNLARLAKAGDSKAEKLFRDSLDFAVRSGRHFKYVWPIQFDVTNFKVITQERSPQGRGQTDCGGLYAYVMLLAHEITGQALYLAEARAALRALEGQRFNLAYQTNLTAYGAIACLKLWLMDRETGYLDQSLVFIAGFLHNCELWDSKIEHAGKYANFFGVTCLHDAPYMAAYECFEAFQAFDEYLRLGFDDIPPAAKMLLCEYRRYALDFTWYFYPDALPADAVTKDNVRNGHTDRTLSFPLEDLYGDGQPAGQVGQEIYGAGGAFIFAARAFDDCADLPLRLFCDYPMQCDSQEDGSLRVRLQGPAGLAGRLRCLKKDRRALPGLRLKLAGTGIAIAARKRSKDYRDYLVPADAMIVIMLRKSGSPA